MKRTVVLFLIALFSVFCQKVLLANIQMIDTIVHNSSMIIYNDMILLEGTIGNEKGYFVWDNGFSFSAVNKSLKIDKEKIEREAISVSDALNQELEMDFYRIRSMSFGNVEVRELDVIEVDIDNIFPCSNLKILGFIGGNIINDYSWNFDFDNSMVKISAEDFKVDDKATIALDFKADSLNNMHYMPISINMFPGWAVVDWGMNGHLDVQGTIGWLFPNTQHRYMIQGNSMSAVSGKKVIAEQTVVDNNYSLRIGEYEVVDKYRPDVRIKDELFSEAVLGNLFFRENFNVVINQGSAKYILQPREYKDEGFIPQSVNYGVTLNKNEDGSLSIDGTIREHSDVIGGGLKPGDKIISINGLGAEYFNSQCELDEYVKAQKAQKKSITLTLEGQKSVVLHLIDIWSIID